MNLIKKHKKLLFLLFACIALLGTISFYFIYQRLNTTSLTCGGLMGTQCPQGLECKTDNNYPDSLGRCVKPLFPITKEISPIPSAAQDSMYQCNNDSDCVYVSDNCGCNGNQAAVNKSYADTWKSKVPTQRVCILSACIEPVPKCVNNVCTLTHERH